MINIITNFLPYRYFGRSKAKHELEVHGLKAEYNIVENAKPSGDQINGNEHERDDMYNYQCNLLDQGLFYLNFIDAVAEGDGNKIIRCWKFLMLHFYAEKKYKYAIEAQYLLLQQYSLLSLRQAYRQRWNRSTNNKGGAGNNVPLDLDLEHDNNYLKESLKKLGPNLTQSSVSRCAKNLKFARNKVEYLSKECAVMKRSGKHFTKSTKHDMAKIVHHLIEKEALIQHPSRHYKYFYNMAPHPLNKKNLSGLCSWINKHKQGIITGRKAQ